MPRSIPCGSGIGWIINGRRIACLLLCVLALAMPALSQSNRYRQLNPEVIEDRLKQHGGSNRARGTALKKLFVEAECSGDRLREDPVPGFAPNVSCTLPGSAAEVIVVGAHFDRVSSSEGVADNWSGASLLPSLYESLSSIQRHHTFVFIGFTEEEAGFVGSEHYVSKLDKQEIKRIRAMVNMDTLGLGPTEIWVSNSDPELVKGLVAIASSMKLPIKGMNVDDVGDSDSRSFKKRKIPTITLHSITDQTLPLLHTRDDNITAIKMNDYYDSYKLIAAFLVWLDLNPAAAQSTSGSSAQESK